MVAGVRRRAHAIVEHARRRRRREVERAGVEEPLGPGQPALIECRGEWRQPGRVLMQDVDAAHGCDLLGVARQGDISVTPARACAEKNKQPPPQESGQDFYERAPAVEGVRPSWSRGHVDAPIRHAARRRGAGAVDRGGLENRCTPLGYRGFESLPLRHTTMRHCA